MADVPIIFDRRIVRRRRARSLSAADRPGFLDAAIAGELADRLASVNRSFATIVVHGSGDSRLRESVRHASAPSLALTADGAVEAGADIVLDLEALPFASGSIDAFVCASGLETANDVPGVLSQLRDIVRPDGLVLAAVLGGETLKELRSAWALAESETAAGASPRIAPFVDVAEWGALLQRAGFAMPVVDRDRLVVRYDDALDLMNDLRRLGFANALVERSRRPTTRRLLERVMEVYRDRNADPDGRVRAAFDVIYLTAWTPHESQPKPLRPGSAKQRLADALNVTEHKVKDG